MKTLRFVTLNRTEQSAAHLENGSGGGAPAKDEVAPFYMANALLPDRYTIWRTADVPADPLYFDIDLGSSLACKAAAVHNFKNVSGVVAYCDVYYMSGGTYPGTPAWTAALSLNLLGGEPDYGGEFDASHIARYWRFAFSGIGGPFSVGKLVLGAVVDLGSAPDPGYTYTVRRVRTEIEYPSGSRVLFDQGRKYRDYAIAVRAVDATAKGVLEALADQAGSFTTIDPDDTVLQAVVRDGSVSISRVWTDVYGVELEIVSLP